jgi:membrane protein implicated in regulation of membrane protease activity
MVGLVFAAAVVALLAGLRVETVVPAVVVVLLLVAVTRRYRSEGPRRFTPSDRDG